MCMYPTVSFNEEEHLSSLLDVLESNEAFTPTHWGNSELVKVEYNRDEIMDKVILEGRVSEVYLYSDNNVKYSGSFDVNWSHRSFLKLEFHKSLSKKLYSVLLDLSDKIAEITKPSYGVTHIYWPTTYPWTIERERLNIWMDICSYPIPVRYLRNGPLGVGARTYFGAHVLEMFDRERLINTPGVVSELKWGGICVDVLDRPFEADHEKLLESWLNVMRYLESSQVIAIPSFDDDHMGVTYTPNSVWKNYLDS